MPLYRAWRLYFDKGYSANVTVTKLQFRETSGGSDYTNTGPSGSAIASGFFDNTFQPRYAFDNSSSEWAIPSSNADSIAHWIGWDAGVGNTFDLAEVAVTVRTSSTLSTAQAQMFREARIEASTNLTRWDSVWHITDFNQVTASGETRVYTRPPLSGSVPYWRVYGLTMQAGGTTAFSISEAQFRDVVGGVDLTQSGSGLSSASVNFSGIVGLSEQLFDNITSSVWSSTPTSPPHWFSYHFTSSVDIKEFVMVARQDFVNSAPTSFQLHSSDNPKTWAVIDAYTRTWVAGQTQSFNVINYGSTEYASKIQADIMLGGRDDTVSISKISTGILEGGFNDRLTIAKISPSWLYGGNPDRVNIAKIAPSWMYGGYPDRVTVAKVATQILFGPRGRNANGPVQIF
jgi:hypothetical protein